MKSKALASVLALALLAISPVVIAAQTNTSGQSAISTDWQELQALKPGQKVLVEFRSGLGDPVEGKFVSAVGSKLTLSDDGSQFSLDQRDIKRIYHLKGRWSRRSTAKIGAVIGTLVGTFLGVRRTIEAEARPGHVPSDADTAPAFAGLAMGGLTGAGIGALIGGKRRARLLYEEK